MLDLFLSIHFIKLIPEIQIKKKSYNTYGWYDIVVLENSCLYIDSDIILTEILIRKFRINTPPHCNPPPQKKIIVSPNTDLMDF